MTRTHTYYLLDGAFGLLAAANTLLLISDTALHRMMSDFEVHIPDESSMHDFLVAFPGPEDSEFVRHLDGSVMPASALIE